MLVNISDFTGKYKLHTGTYVQADIQAYIDKYEPRYLRELFGAELYADFISDIDQQTNEPKSPNFQFVFNPFAIDQSSYVMLVSEGIKEMLLGFIYFEYAKDLTNQMTPYGNVQNKSELSNNVTSLNSMMWTRYNESVKTFSAIRDWIYLNRNTPAGQGIDGGVTITAAGTGYTGGSNVIPTPLSGIVLSLSVDNIGTGYATNNGVATSGGSGTGLTVDYIDDGAGGVLSVTINNYGSGYKIGDVVTILDGNNDATLTIDDASQIITGTGLKVTYVAQGIGEIVNTTLTAAGSGYTTATQVPTTGGGGNGCVVNIQDDGAGGVLSLTIADGGTGYAVNDVLTIDAGNQDATFIVANVLNGEVDFIFILPATNGGIGYKVGDLFGLLNEGDGLCTFELDYVGIGDFTKYNGVEKLMAYWI
jgi:hypothetical protein